MTRSVGTVVMVSEMVEWCWLTHDAPADCRWFGHFGLVAQDTRAIGQQEIFLHKFKE